MADIKGLDTLWGHKLPVRERVCLVALRGRVDEAFRLREEPLSLGGGGGGGEAAKITL